MLSQGAPDIRVYPFNGQLFDLRRTDRLMAQSCENKFLLKAVYALTHVDVGGLRQRVNYAELGVEELGSVYETLLDYIPRCAEQPTPVEGVIVPSGTIYLAPLTTERKDLGTHYTRPPLVDFLLSVSLDRLIAERLVAVGDDKEARIRGLLDLRVCDAACGSGAILVGAIDRIALALATVRADGQKPTEAMRQEARREVLAHCIYGVDKDDFAVELCKVALWIHCAVPNLPLSFLDHRIQHGDSLLGWPLLDVPSLIPEDAYRVPNNLPRDDDGRRLREFLQCARESNLLSIQGQGELGQILPKPDIRVDFPAVMAEEERIPGDVDRKDTAFKGYLQSDAYRRFKAAADLWTAAFFWSHEVGVPTPTTADYNRAFSGEFDAEQVKAATEILGEFPAFHWPLRFPEIAARGGFDCFVGNPPWEQVKLQEQEWFAPRDPAIAMMPSAPRRAAIVALSEKNPKLWHQWRVAEVAYDRLAEFMRNSGRYGSSEHEPNTYLLFTELVADALRSNGRAGIIVKSALGLDQSAQRLFQKLVNAGKVEEFHDFVNGGGTVGVFIFTDVNEHVRFVVLGLRGSSNNTEFQATMLNFSIDEAKTRPRVTMTPEILKMVNPRTRTLLSYRRPIEFDVAIDIHRRLPTLDIDEGGSNPWGLKYLRLFDSSGAAELFLRRENLELEGWELGSDMIFRRKGKNVTEENEGMLAFDKASDFEEALPLYEGQLANRYDHRARTYSGYQGTNKYGRKPAAPISSDHEKANPQFEIEPRYWMYRRDAAPRLREAREGSVFLGFRDVAVSFADARCAKAALIPHYPATDKLPIFAIAADRAFEFLGIFNSTTFDFLLRGHLPGATVRLKWMLSQLAVPLPGMSSQRVAENAAKLSLTSYSVARLFGQEPHIWNPEERYALDVDTDALVAHAYRLTAAQYNIMLESFEVLARLEHKLHGRYKFKDDCLAAYERLG
jgi:hypothetical protein